MEVTLDMLLASRDKRHQRQTDYLRRFPDKTLMCLTVVMPGSIKRNKESLTVAKAAMKALRQHATQVEIMEELDLETGYEAYALTDMSEKEAKRLACDIEESTPMGRLFDIDVIGKDGAPLSRQSIGLPARRCLICDNEARYCMRNHSHTREEIQNKIKELTSRFSPITYINNV